MVPVTVVHQTEFVKIEVNPELKYIQITWLQQPTNTLYRAETMDLVQYAMAHGYEISLFDVRQRDYLPIAEQNWLVRDVFPLFKDQKIKLAYLVNAANLQMMDTFRIHDSVHDNPELQTKVHIDIFLNLEDALEWLFQKK